MFIKKAKPSKEVRLAQKKFWLTVAASIMVLALLVTGLFYINQSREERKDDSLLAESTYLTFDGLSITQHAKNAEPKTVLESREMDDFVLLGKKYVVVTLYSGDIIVKNLETEVVQTIPGSGFVTDSAELSDLQAVSSDSFGLLRIVYDNGLPKGQVVTVYNAATLSSFDITKQDGSFLNVSQWKAANDEGFLAYQEGDSDNTYLYDIDNRSSSLADEYATVGGFFKQDNQLFLWGSTDDPTDPVRTYNVKTNASGTLATPGESSREIVSQITGLGSNNSLLWRVTGNQDGDSLQYFSITEAGKPTRTFLKQDTQEALFYENYSTTSDGALASISLQYNSGNFETRIINTVTGRVVKSMPNVTKAVFFNE